MLVQRSGIAGPAGRTTHLKVWLRNDPNHPLIDQPVKNDDEAGEIVAITYKGLLDSRGWTSRDLAIVLCPNIHID